MTASHDLERRVAAFYATEAPRRAPDRVLEQALATINTTRQRRELVLVPWRLPTMNSYAKLAVAAVVVLAAGALGLALLRPGPGPSVGGPVPLPSASPALTATFTSTIHGLSIAYPGNWTTVPATGPDPSAEPGFLNPAADWLHDPRLRDHLMIVLDSTALEGRTGETWAGALFDDPDLGCADEREPITVDGAPGLICDTLALTWVGDRGYAIRLYVSDDDPEVGELYDRAWFEAVLATVELPSGT
jgi:hypothetical protein